MVLKKSVYHHVQKLSIRANGCEKINPTLHQDFMISGWLFGIRGKLNLKEYQGQEHDLE